MRTLARSLAALGLGAAVLLTALPAGAAAEDDAAEAIEDYMNAAFAGDWAATYEMLPSAQSDLFTEDEWVACQDLRNGHLVGAELDNLKVVKSKKQRAYEIPGTDETARALAVTIQATATLGEQTQQERDTVYVIREGKSWHPSVREANVEACLTG